MRVLLISMPFGPVDTPSMSLGLLAAGLARRGIGCGQRYFNVEFTSRIGVTNYFGVASYGLSGEWLFSGALFGEQAPDPEGYLQMLLDSGGTKPSRANRLRELRVEAERFIDDCLRAEDWGRYDVVGFTSAYFQQVASLALARRLKRAHPNLLIAFGGANCECGMGAEMLRRFPFVDLAFSGEADVTFPDTLARLEQGRTPDGLPGVCWRDAKGIRLPEEWVQPVEDLDGLPFPDFGPYFRAFEASPMAGRIDPVVLLETSRGCWWGARNQCKFCGLNGSSLSYRSKSPARVLHEISHLADRYGDRIATTDNILDMDYFGELLPRLARSDLRLKLFYETKSNLSREEVAALRAAGVRSIQPGIESLSTPVLQRMRKGCTALQNVQLLKWCYEYGIWPSWNLLVGFPGEDPAEYEKMARWVPVLAHLPAPARVQPVRLDRFSPYFLEPERHGLCNVRPAPGYRHIYPFGDDSLRELAYFFKYDHRDGRDVWSYARPLSEAVTRHWRPGPHLGALRMRDGGETIRISDARPVARRRNVALSGPEREVYLLCDRARSLTRLERELAPSHGEWVRHRLRPFLVEMTGSGLMLEDGERFLALAVTPRRPLPALRPDRAPTYLLG